MDEVDDKLLGVEWKRIGQARLIGIIVEKETW